MAHRLASLKFAISGLINTLANGGVDFLPCFTKVPVMLDILLLNSTAKYSRIAHFLPPRIEHLTLNNY